MRICAIILSLLLVGTAVAADPDGAGWTPKLTFQRGLNIESDKGLLSADELYQVQDFVWENGEIWVRDGYMRYAAPLTDEPVRFIDLFKTTSGQSYLMYSDGEKIWYRQGLVSASVQIPVGYSNSDSVKTFFGSNLFYGNSVDDQLWRTQLGTAEGQTFTVAYSGGDIDYTISEILLDTLVVVGGSPVAQNDTSAYALGSAIAKVKAGISMSDNYWIYTNVGKVQFTSPDSVLTVDSLTGTRYAYTAVTRECNVNYGATLRFAVTGINGYQQQGKFARLVTNPFSVAVDSSALEEDRVCYTSYPIVSGGIGYFNTTAAAVPPKASQKLIVEDLIIDEESKSFFIADSIKVENVDSTNFSCTGSEALALRIYCDTCDFQDDTTRYWTGDWFYTSPYLQSYIRSFETVDLEVADIDTLLSWIPFTTPAQTTVKAYDSVEFRIYVAGGLSGNKTDGTMKGWVYLASDSSFIDSTYTLTDTLTNTSSQPTTKTAVLKFANKTELIPSTDYYFGISRPDSFQIVGLRDLQRLEITYLDTANATPKTSAYECYPVVGGYVDSDSAIVVMIAKTNAGSVESYPHLDDSDTCMAMMFRMKPNKSIVSDGGYVTASVYQDRVFYVVDTLCNHLLWTEPFLPDSHVATSDMIINSEDGDCIIGLKEQWGDLIVYMPNSRWRVTGDGTNQGYAKERLNGSIGCAALGSLLNIDNNHYFLATDGFYSATGADAPVRVSNAVNSYFTDSLNTDRYDKVAAGYDKENNDIWISFPRVGSNNNSITLVYNIPTQTWWRQSFVAGAYAYNADFGISDTVRFIAGGVDSSTIFVAGGATDDGVDIDAYLQTGYFDYESPERFKRITDYLFSIDNNSADSIVGDVYADTVTAALNSLSYTPFAGWWQQRVAVPDAEYIGNYVSHKFTIYDGSGTGLRFLKIKFRVGGETE